MTIKKLMRGKIKLPGDGVADPTGLPFPSYDHVDIGEAGADPAGQEGLAQIPTDQLDLDSLASVERGSLFSFLVFHPWPRLPSLITAIVNNSGIY